MKKIIWLVDSNLSASHPALEKVVRIATRLKLEVDLILDDRMPSTERWYWLQLREAKEDVGAPPRYFEQLRSTIKSRFAASNIKYSVAVSSSKSFLASLSETIVKDALLVFQENTRIPHHPAFDLARKFTCNILFLTQKPWHDTPRVTAAIDPLHENDRPATLDRYIIDVTKKITLNLEAQLDIVHCCSVSPLALKYKDQITDIHRDTVHDFIKDIHFTHKNVHILMGVPEMILPSWIKENKIDLLCLGYIARNRLHNYLVGSTTYALLAAPPCDMLMLHQSS